MSCMKGQSVLVSHAFVVGMSVVVILVVITALKTISEDNRDFIGRSEISQVCSIIKSASEKVLPEQLYVSPTNTSAARITVNLPERIAELRFRTRIAADDIIIETSGDVLLNETCKIGLNASYSGSTAGGRTLVELIRHANSTKEIRISNE